MTGAAVTEVPGSESEPLVPWSTKPTVVPSVTAGLSPAARLLSFVCHENDRSVLPKASERSQT